MSTPAIAIIINTKPNIQFFALQCFTPMRHTPIIIFEQHSVFTLTDSYLYLRIYYLLCMKYITFFGTVYSSVTHYKFLHNALALYNAFLVHFSAEFAHRFVCCPPETENYGGCREEVGSLKLFTRVKSQPERSSSTDFLFIIARHKDCSISDGKFELYEVIFCYLQRSTRFYSILC